jgi:hypothetical protein
LPVWGVGCRYGGWLQVCTQPSRVLPHPLCWAADMCMCFGWGMASGTIFNSALGWFYFFYMAVRGASVLFWLVVIVYRLLACLCVCVGRELAIPCMCMCARACVCVCVLHRVCACVLRSWHRVCAYMRVCLRAVCAGPTDPPGHS